MTNFIIFHQHVNLKFILLPPVGKDILRCQIMIIPLFIKISRKTWDHWEATTGPQETQPLCGLARGIKPETIWVKPLAFFHALFWLLFLIFVFDPYFILVLVHCLASWNSWNLLSLLGPWDHSRESNLEIFRYGGRSSLKTPTPS